MRLLLSTPVFAPQVGGMETMAHNLATHFHARGIDVHLVTPVTSTRADQVDYDISRGLPPGRLLDAARRADVVLSNGAGLYIAPYAIAARKPLVFVHANYVASTVEGSGYAEGRVLPHTPWRSIGYNLRHRLSWFVVRNCAKLLVMRYLCRRVVAANVAISDWMVQRQPFPRQVRIYNPFPVSRFAVAAQPDGRQQTHDALYLGRLTGEKGLRTLVRAVAHLRYAHRRRLTCRLLIIGDGPERDGLEQLATELRVREHVAFAGTLQGRDLLTYLRAAPVAVVPSSWEEPFGGVTTELMAAGKGLIVSARGAPAELAGAAALTFPNDDYVALADSLARVMTDAPLRARLRRAALENVKHFDEAALIDQYVALLEAVTRGEQISPSSHAHLNSAASAPVARPQALNTVEYPTRAGRG